MTFLYLIVISYISAKQVFQEINIQGVVERPNTIYMLQKSKLSKKVLKKDFDFKAAAFNAIDDNILKEY